MKKHTHSNEEPNIISKWLFKYGNEIIRKKTEEKLEKLMKEQEIKENAEKYSELQEGTYTIQHKTTYKHGFIDGYKLAEEGRYSEEDLEKAWEDGRKFEHDHNGGEGGEFTGAESFTEWFTQFKNK